MPDAPNANERRARLLQDFTDLIAIASPSLKERKMAEALRRKLLAAGYEVFEDGAGEAAGGECGNIIGIIKPTAPALPAVALLSHMDTVLPCENKSWTVEGDIVRSCGNAILGGDDAAGMAAALEIARRVTEEGVPHGGLALIFTIGEEVGLFGARYLDHEIIKKASADGEFPKHCFVFDSSGEKGRVVSRAPSHSDVKFTVTGKAAHAGVEPEKGLNAISVISEAIAAMKLGRIDDETTSNIGKIYGGLALNIVCETAAAEGEVRSHDRAKLEAQVAHMKECVRAACERRGAKFEFEEDPSYNAFCLTPDDEIIKLLSQAAKARGYDLKLMPTGGGSDANVLNEIGIPTANLAVGMYEVHSTKEYANISEIEETAALVTEFFKRLA